MAVFGRLGKVRHMSIDNVKKVDINTIIPYKNTQEIIKTRLKPLLTQLRNLGGSSLLS